MTERQIGRNPDSVSICLSLKEQHRSPAGDPGQKNLATEVEGGRADDLCFSHFSMEKETCPCPRPWHHGNRLSLIFEIIQPRQFGEKLRTQKPEMRRNETRAECN